MSRLTVLLLGDTQRPEFTSARQDIERLARVIAAPDVDAACEMLTWAGLSEAGSESRRHSATLDDDPIAVNAIVVAQAYPGEFSSEALDQLSRLAPLARVVELLGSWCEGEVRTGRPWPGAIRVYWHQWPARCHRELGRMAQGLFTSWCLPPTASDEERLLAEPPLPAAAQDQETQGLIAIRSPSYDMRQWLSEACRRVGYATTGLVGGRWQVVDGEPDSQLPSTACHSPHVPPTTYHLPPVQTAIFDALDCRDEEIDDLKRLIDAVRPAPVIVLMTCPRIEDHDRLLAAGAAAILSKPVALEDLDWLIRNLRSQISDLRFEI